MGHQDQRRHQTRSTGRGFCRETPQTSQGLWSHTAQPVQKLLPSSLNMSIMKLCFPLRTSAAHLSLLSSSLCSRGTVIPACSSAPPNRSAGLTSTSKPVPSLHMTGFILCYELHVVMELPYTKKLPWELKGLSFFPHHKPHLCLNTVSCLCHPTMTRECTLCTFPPLLKCQPCSLRISVPRPSSVCISFPSLSKRL